MKYSLLSRSENHYLKVAKIVFCSDVDQTKLVRHAQGADKPEQKVVNLLWESLRILRFLWAKVVVSVKAYYSDNPNSNPLTTTYSFGRKYLLKRQNKLEKRLALAHFRQNHYLLWSYDPEVQIKRSMAAKKSALKMFFSFSPLSSWQIFSTSRPGFREEAYPAIGCKSFTLGTTFTHRRDIKIPRFLWEFPDGKLEG